jgi:hypothetical protein
MLARSFVPRKRRLERDATTYKGSFVMATLIFTLKQHCLNKVADAAGFWEIEGGEALEKEKRVADYSSVMRTSCGTKQQDVAQLWMTLFFPDQHPPQNISLHGAHDLKSSNEIGSVSAASPTFAAHIGKPFKRVANTLTIG